MLGRYQIRRGAKLDDLPARVRAGVRMDTRKHTRHLLRPTAELVTEFLGTDPGSRDAAWQRFRAGYEALLAERFATDRAAFDALAATARERDVFLGCSCPSAANPEVLHCHTVLALRFLAERYRDLEIEWPEGASDA